MKNIKTLIILASVLTSASISYAASHAVAPATPASTSTPVTAAVLPMVDAEVRKIDLENKKITLKHGEIKNLDMPGMTMVFQVKDPAMLDKVKTGDKVKFSADKISGAIVVTNIQPSK